MWNYRQIPVKLQLGDKTLLEPKLWLQIKEAALDDENPPVAALAPPTDPLLPDSQGFLIRSLPIAGNHPVLSRQNGYLCYVSSQYSRYYIDMRQSFEEYKSKFSSKTRSTLNRKIKKFSEYCGGEIQWKVYRAVGEMREFFELARTVSEKTYQEKLLDAGLPDSEEFLREMERLARQDGVRGFILFHQNKPVSYLYCPVTGGIVVYAYLGYDPGYMNFSVGTILQWLALERLFKENSFRFFDFTEGQSDHKKLFATDSVHCANVFFLRNNLRNLFLSHTQISINRVSKAVGNILEQLGVKTAVRKAMRFGK
jgi:CelD/BcsL family acetyltransferase involved in cellulose biosynthesis